MNIPPAAAIALVLSLLAFAGVQRSLRGRPMTTRLAWFFPLMVLALPGALFGLYYRHVLPEWEGFYTLRSWPGSELLMVFVGAAGGALAAMLSRVLAVFPFLLAAALGAAPLVKSFVDPLAQGDIKNRWEGEVCLQSTGSTCGPASVCTMLKHFGITVTEGDVARAAYTTMSGTEAWYLARFVRRQGLMPRFCFRDTFSPEAGLPAMVGVHQGSTGHFIVVLEQTGSQLTIADPMRGEEHLSMAEFQHRYQFTGFHMVISRQ